MNEQHPEMRSIYVTDWGEVEIPPEWEMRFLHAEVEDYRKGRVRFGVFLPSWDARHAVGRAFEAEHASKIEAL